jgi:hypothetical protein
MRWRTSDGWQTIRTSRQGPEKLEAARVVRKRGPLPNWNQRVLPSALVHEK